MKILFIDDQKDILKLLKDALGNRRDDIGMAFRESHEYLDAMMAIRAENPDILFLDHSLSKDGDEGFEIIAGLKKSGSLMRIVSTTSDDSVAEVYRTLFGVNHVEKSDVKKIEKIIAAFAAASGR